MCGNTHHCCTFELWKSLLKSVFQLLFCLNPTVSGGSQQKTSLSDWCLLLNCVGSTGLLHVATNTFAADGAVNVEARGCCNIPSVFTLCVVKTRLYGNCWEAPAGHQLLKHHDWYRLFCGFTMRLMRDFRVRWQMTVYSNATQKSRVGANSHKNWCLRVGYELNIADIL